MDGRRRVSRRGLGIAAGAAVVGGGGWALTHRNPADSLIPSTLPGAGSEPHAWCADPSSLKRTGAIGSAELVYEVDQKATPMRFDPGFHSQLVRWLADWNTTSRYGGVQQLWSYGAHVAKDGCASWHANGRAFDFSRLRAGNTLLVSCRTDLWHEAAPERQRELARRYWTLAASLHLHFAYVLTVHFDALHANHIHVDNGISGSAMSRFDPTSRVQNQAVQAISQTIWGRPGQVSGEWSDTREQVGPVLAELGLRDLSKQTTWQAFLRASVARG